MTLIDREPLRKKIRRRLVRQLIAGELEPGTHINESQLAEDFGVSRTPLREALLQLEFEGFLDSIPGKGFRVRPLSVKEAEHLFAVGIVLEAMALRLSGELTEQELHQLRAIDDERKILLRKGNEQRRLVELDDNWHRQLVQHCKNTQLLELVRLVRNRLYRYVLAFEGHSDDVADAIQEHGEILAALERGDVEEAIVGLRNHWNSGREVVARIAATDSES